MKTLNDLQIRIIKIQVQQKIKRMSLIEILNMIHDLNISFNSYPTLPHAKKILFLHLAAEKITFQKNYKKINS